jgi:hypothetical protein
MNMSEAKSIDQKKIQEAIDCLEGILSERPLPVSVMVETSEDEAIMVGTNQAFVWLTLRLLKALQDADGHQSKRIEFGGCETKCVVLEAVFNSLGHVVPSVLCVTNSDEDNQTVVKFFQEINP